SWGTFLPEHRARGVSGCIGRGPVVDEVHVWRIALDHARVPPPTAGESARAARFRTGELAQRYLKSHGALRDILARYTSVPLEFALHEKGKPYLPLAPEVRFNLSHSHEMALVAVSLE